MENTIGKNLVLACAGFSNSLIWMTLGILSDASFPVETKNIIRFVTYIVSNYVSSYLATRRIDGDFIWNSVLCGFASFFLYSLLGILFITSGRSDLPTFISFISGSFLGGGTNSLFMRRKRFDKPN